MGRVGCVQGAGEFGRRCHGSVCMYACVRLKRENGFVF